MDKQRNVWQEPIDRRKALQLVTRALAGLSFVALGACVPRSVSKYSVKVIFSQQSHSYFEPSKLVIPLGATVVWQNQAIYPVTVTCDPSKVKSVSTNDVAATSAAYVKLPQGASPWDSGTLYPGQTWEHTFKTPGDYLYFSQYIENPYLVGIVSVQ